MLSILVLRTREQFPSVARHERVGDKIPQNPPFGRGGIFPPRPKSTIQGGALLPDLIFFFTHFLDNRVLNFLVSLAPKLHDIVKIESRAISHYAHYNHHREKDGG